MKKGIDQRKRPELTGGGLVRSLGGWSMIKKLRLKGQDHIKGLGYDLKKISQMVSKIYDIETKEIYSKRDLI